ncbi:MAG TPA: formate--tetrahydrofolate ligase [Bacillota bacterium]
MLSDIEIANQSPLRPIREVAIRAGIDETFLEPYGKYKAKIDLGLYRQLASQPDGKLIYVTAITPTPAGEGKTCTAVGLTQALGKLGKRVMLCLREPSLGPTFGVKGGATGGGYSQVLPMDEINLHFTGDIHAVTTAHNLLAAMVDNHITQGNELGIEPKKIVWRRVMDISDRQLRNIIVGLGGKTDGVTRETGFDITAASEIMAVLCLASNLEDLKERLGRILVAYNGRNEPVYARDLKAVGAMAALLKDAVKPNLVQTLEGQPALIHGGPFANIAHGNNSIIATRMALKLADYVVTEGGFATDLGAEKFFDIVSPVAGLKPDAAVLVVSARALKFHGGIEKLHLGEENLAALEKGFANLERHLRNLHSLYKLPVVVAVNRFPNDTPAELQAISDYCTQLGVPATVSEVVARGGEGGVELAGAVLETLKQPNGFKPLYDHELPLRAKIETIATQVYGAARVNYSKEAETALNRLTELGYARLSVCIAKTQMSFSDDPSLKGAPSGWTLTIREIRLLAGAGFVVAIAGTIMTMPGLPKHPSAENVDITGDGEIKGLF